VIGGLFPRTALAITRAAQAGDRHEATRLSERLQPLWSLFRQQGGSLRVITAAAELQGLVKHSALPLPLKALDGASRQRLAVVLDELELSR
jgi:4-hydroxy-tetrahydrodipicolinate synthase